jgi:Protein of unknown function (DUF2934)
MEQELPIKETAKMADQQENLPTREEIERRAYEIYLERGAADGDEARANLDWLTAERELTEIASPNVPNISKVKSIAAGAKTVSSEK